MELGYCLVSPASSGYQAFLFRRRPVDGLRQPMPMMSRDKALADSVSSRLVQNKDADIKLREYYRIALDFGWSAARKAQLTTKTRGDGQRPQPGPDNRAG